VLYVLGVPVCPHWLQSNCLTHKWRATLAATNWNGRF